MCIDERMPATPETQIGQVTLNVGTQSFDESVVRTLAQRLQVANLIHAATVDGAAPRNHSGPLLRVLSQRAADASDDDGDASRSA